LEKVLESGKPDERKSSSYTYEDLAPTASKVGEMPAAYGIHPVRGNSDTAGKPLYTLEDYLKLPDEQRVELIDGVFYDMAAPTTVHQSIAGFLYKKFLDFVMENKGPCFPFISPVDVQLDCDDKTVVQPDVLVVCDRSKYRNGRVFGAPDLVVEVLSPSSRKKDMQIKLAKYYNAGVREYWIIDPEKKLLVQYDMEHLELPVVYNADMEIPVLIWDGTCRIDLKEMYEAISFLWETD
jgi:Uma2 family endonuclease